MSEHGEPKLGINSWLEEELYTTWLNDRKNVDESWKKRFEGNGHATAGNGSATVSNGAAPAPPAPVVRPAQPAAPPPALGPTDELQQLKGAALKIAENMAVSLTVPTATSQRAIAVRTLEQQRSSINKLRDAAGLPKLSFTHFIAWAIVQSVREHPNLNNGFTEQNGDSFRIVRKSINLGIAVDVMGKDGNASLMVPNIKDSGSLNFASFLAAFDDIVARARTGKLQMPDFQGTTVSLTNPGTVGTVGSVPRLMAGQGAIIATGAMDYPAEYRTVTAEKIAELGISKVMMVTCTYDHRVIQGAESGRFLARLQTLLEGGEGFYDSIRRDLALDGPAPAAAVSAPPAVAETAAPATVAVASDARKEVAVMQLLQAYRDSGHLLAKLDPLGSEPPVYAELSLDYYGLAAADLSRPFLATEGRTLADTLDVLRKTYCDRIGVEYTHIPDTAKKEWLRQYMEPQRNAWPLDRDKRLRILELLIRAEELERFLHTRFLGKKRFSVEGSEASIPALDEILDRCSAVGAREAIIGMAHRGRLNVLANIVGKSYAQVFAEFEEAPDSTSNMVGSGDVKYHLGASGTRGYGDRQITVSVAFNPSHLEAVDPVVVGMVRPKQDALGDTLREQVLPILIHGDAAFSGQGVVPETLNLSQLEGYTVGGTIHLVINNQLGFTTMPSDGRSGTYATDIAKAINAPIFHVNADDPEAVLRMAQLAYDYRQQFKADVVLDMIGYRRHGHNEGDDPTYTQPLMYKAIKNHPSVVTLYSERLVKEGLITKDEANQLRKRILTELSEGYETSKKNSEKYELQDLPPVTHEPVHSHTAISREIAALVLDGIHRVPEGFHLHPKIKGFIEKRREAGAGAPMDWATGEAMAFGSLLVDGYSVRLSGQDVGRGTFSQRHLEFHDYDTGRKHVPLMHMSPGQARFEAWCSSLSEYAVMGFEFGFSLADPGTLVIWEGQFGDFVNGAQIIVDQFLSSAETKWGQPSGLVLLLPHGYEGMGPEHSSARIERFLQLCAEGNMQVANCTTPAQYFHILRRQMIGPDGKPVRKPLVLFTPKSMLRDPRAVSTMDELIQGSFREVLPDPAAPDPAKVKRILMCSGKVYYDLFTGREKRGLDNVAIVRVEQMYPYPQAQIADVLNTYPFAEVYWVQEEPRNMGAYRFMMSNTQPLLDSMKRGLLGYAGRAESASPACGTFKRHEEEQATIVEDAFASTVVQRKPRRVRVVRKKK